MIAILEGRFFSGIKMPPINNNGNFTRFMRIITSDVISVGLADIKRPKREPRSPINDIPIKIMKNEFGDIINVGKNIMKIMEITEVTGPIAVDVKKEVIATIPINI
jgi:hypothetical protein